MVNESTTDPVGATPTTERWVSCGIPGCTHRMPYSGRGAPPKYCGQSVQGVKHTRLTAYRLAKGQIMLPSLGAGQAAASEGEQRGEEDGEQARPVTAARMTLELLLAEVSAQVIGYEQRIGVLAEQISQAVCTAVDAEAVAAEVSAAHRGARVEVDRAEAERDQAIGHARQAQRAVEAAEERATMAELTAEEALAEAETAHLARDQAISERDEHSAAAALAREELEAARVQADQLREQVATLQHDTAELTCARTELTSQLAQQRQQTESAERHAIRVAAQAEQLSTELATARGQLERWQAHAAELRADLAGVRSELTATSTAAQTEKDHAAQRLADQQVHYHELISELRAQIHQPTTPRVS